MNVEEARREWLSTLTPSDRIVFSQPVPIEAFRVAFLSVVKCARCGVDRWWVSADVSPPYCGTCMKEIARAEPAP